jgi:hypothetical protein
LGKIQRNQSKPQRKRQTPSSNQDDGHSYHDNKDVETPYNSSEYLQNPNSSTDSRASTQGTNAADLGESPLPEVPLNPLYFPTIPEGQQHSNFARFLGPDLIEDLFGPELEHSGDFVPPNIGSGVMSFSRGFDSLDQYVSTLDMQKGQERLLNINDLANDGSSSLYTSPGNVAFDTGGIGPFIPLSPYLIQMYSPTGNHPVPSRPGGFLPDDYFMVAQNNSLQETRLQGMPDDREILWTRPEG